MKIINVFTLLLLPTLGTSQKAEFTNNTKETIWVAIAFFQKPRRLEETRLYNLTFPESQSGQGTWITKGWYQIKPNSTLAVGDCAAFAQSNGNEWAGFSIKNENSEIRWDKLECTTAMVGGKDLNCIGRKRLAVNHSNDFEILNSDKKSSSDQELFYILKSYDQNFSVIIE